MHKDDKKKENQFEAQKKAIEFQEMYYPINYPLTQNEMQEAVRFAFSQGWAMCEAKNNQKS